MHMKSPVRFCYAVTGCNSKDIFTTGSETFLPQWNCVGLMCFPTRVCLMESKHTGGNLEPLPAGKGTESTLSYTRYSATFIFYGYCHIFVSQPLWIKHELCMLIRPSKEKVKCDLIWIVWFRSEFRGAMDGSCQPFPDNDHCELVHRHYVGPMRNLPSENTDTSWFSGALGERPKLKTEHWGSLDCKTEATCSREHFTAQSHRLQFFFKPLKLSPLECRKKITFI